MGAALNQVEQVLLEAELASAEAKARVIRERLGRGGDAISSLPAPKTRARRMLKVVAPQTDPNRPRDMLDEKLDRMIDHSGHVRLKR